MVTCRFCLTLLLTGLVYGQRFTDCDVWSSGGLPVRAGGKAEIAGEVILHCQGNGVPTPLEAPVPTYTIRVRAGYASPASLLVPRLTYTAPVNVTSRTFTPGGLSEVLLLIDEPHSLANSKTPLLVCDAPDTGCPVKGTGTGFNVYDGSTGRPNVYQGRVVAPDTVEWAAIPLDAPGTTAVRRTFRILNLRVDATTVPTPPVIGILPAIVAIVEVISADGVAIRILGHPSNPPRPGAYAYLGQVSPEASGLTSNPVTLPQCQASNEGLRENPGPVEAAFWVQINGVFKRRNLAFGTSRDLNQNVTGFGYRSESGFVNLGPARDPVPNPPGQDVFLPVTAAFPEDLLQAGVADQGSRYAVLFQSVPDGVGLFVPTIVNVLRPRDGAVVGHAVLIHTDESGAGPFSAVADLGGGVKGFDSTGLAEVPIENGSGRAVYESPDATENGQIRIPVALSYSAGAPATGVQSMVMLATAPFSADSTSPIPRFGAGGLKKFDSVVRLDLGDIPLEPFEPRVTFRFAGCSTLSSRISRR